jgi:3',5'-cyclic AMP phosphodiesterase CpdA
MFVLAHLTDPHLAPLPRPRMVELAGKRVLGFINWQRNRRRIHRSDLLAAIVTDLKAAAPDHVAVTGDLVNIALEAEFIQAAQWLSQLGVSHDVTYVPGNHDAYVRAAETQAARHWSAYMRGDELRTERFPFVRRRGPIALIGLSSAVATQPFMATGAIGTAQLARLTPLLDQLGKAGLFRVVLIHHPPLSTTAARHKRLIDAAALRTVLQQHGAELVLHGHDHVHALVRLDGPSGTIPAIGLPSASAAREGDGDPAAYNLYRIEGTAGAWRCEAITRGLGAEALRIVELRRQILIGTG